MLRAAGGDLSQAARMMTLDRWSLQRKVREYEIDVEEIQGRHLGAAAGRSWCGRMPQRVKCLTMRELCAFERCLGVRQRDAPEGEEGGICGVREGHNGMQRHV